MDEWRDQRRLNKKCINIKGSIRVILMVDIMRVNTLRWYILRREKTESIRLVKVMYVEKKWGRKRLKKRWLKDDEG